MGSNFPKISVVYQGFQIVQEIGGGGFSTVYKAVNFDDKRVAACKHIAITARTTPKERKDAEKEMRIHAQLKHQHVLEFYSGAVLDHQHAHKYVPGYYLLMELAAGGDLFDKIAPDVGVSDEVAHLYFNQLVCGMQFIHDEGVCHRDLKPENLLLDAAGTLKICDFGLSAVYKLKQTGQVNRKKEYSGEPIDVWGMGVILFTLLAGNTPWDEASTASPEYCDYLSGTIFQQDPWNRFGSDALSLLQGLLAVDPRERFTISDAGQHRWCMRPSQLARQSAAILAEKLTENLRMNGDMGYAAPVISGEPHEVDMDGDQVMHSQFTQSLMLFSQTQAGVRYTPHLTRFYAKLGPTLLLQIITETLESLNVACKAPPEQPQGMLKLRIGGYDKRREKFKGWVEIEHFKSRAHEGSFVVMQRDVVSVSIAYVTGY
ncbi:Chk1 protein kinase [Paramarasmius palmivorus]|uniref:non-specific serine/threonine protein kinase n=1 Tax=Paramarasmius palmivorus TaxID=297713 RepID=A0AAW0D6S7_9AGAR